jgi:hypothetical protein
MAWRPVLDGDDAERARAVVAEIADALATPPGDDPSLGAGSAGIALLHGYRALDGDEASEERTFDALAHALEHAGTRPLPSLFNGLGGIAFAAQHLQPVVGEVEALETLDEIVRRLLDDPRLTREVELCDGWIGFGVVALERPALAPLVERAVAALDAWRTGDPVNLGLAHGVAGTVAFLARVADARLREIVPWLRGHIGDRFPIPMSDPEILGVRADGWCYGEPSTAVALVAAGRALAEPAWIDAGRALANRAAARTDAELAALGVDAAFCHGTAGRAHLLNRLGQALGDDALVAAARAWYRETLARGAVGTPGIQAGDAGVALSLLGAVSGVEPAWDRALLTSLAPASP